MNWDAIGAIAELLGAVGVIASLIYLATQIRQSRDQMTQNTRAMRAGAYQQFWGQFNEHLSAPSENPEYAEVIQSGLTDFAGLDPKDAWRFSMWAQGAARSHDNGYYQYRVGMLDEERWQMHRGSVRLFYTQPGAVQWWEAVGRRASFSPEYVALVSEVLGDEPEA